MPSLIENNNSRGSIPINWGKIAKVISEKRIILNNDHLERTKNSISSLKILTIA